MANNACAIALVEVVSVFGIHPLLVESPANTNASINELNFPCFEVSEIARDFLDDLLPIRRTL